MSSDLIAALQNPELYDHEVDGFQIMETHISWVILTGPYAYKIKKPMDFGFLNFTTLDKRRHYCHEELRLNRRLAPALYLDVLPISGTSESPVLGGDGEAFEYAIKMAQFPQEGLLDQLQAQDKLTNDHIDALADQIAQFHQTIQPVAQDSALGSAAEAFAPMQQNFDQIRPLISDTDLLAQLDQLEAWTQDTYTRLQPVLEQRKAQGFVRECHGDIHLGNVTVYQNQVVLFDCIEFNDEFRWIDIINDIAFLVMDLEDRGLQSMANRALNAWLEATGDFEGLQLLTFYKAYRAMVRAKVALFTMGAPGMSDAAKAELMERYRRYANLAESCMAIPNRFMLIMHGVSGSGKTTVGNGIIEALGVIRIRSDVERKRLFGLAPTDKSHSDIDSGIYTDEATNQTYTRVGEIASQVLSFGYPVLIDATHLKQWQRQALQDSAEANGVPDLIVACEANIETIRRWLTERAEAGNDASEASLQVLDRQLASLEPLTEEEQQHTLVIHTENAAETTELANLIKAHLKLV